MPVHQTIIPPLQADPDPLDYEPGTLLNVDGTLKVVNEAQDGFDTVGGGGGGSPPVVGIYDMLSPEFDDGTAWALPGISYWEPELEAANKAIAYRDFQAGSDLSLAFTLSYSEFPEGWQYYGLKLLVVDSTSGTAQRDITVRYGGGGGGGYSGDQNAVTITTTTNGPQAEEIDLDISINVPSAGGYSVVEIFAENDIFQDDFGLAKILIYERLTAPNPDP